jgi:hypothetical protein
MCDKKKLKHIRETLIVLFEDMLDKFPQCDDGDGKCKKEIEELKQETLRLLKQQKENL